MESGTVLYCDSESDKAAIEQARQWIKENGHTLETVKLLKRINLNDDSHMTVVVFR